MTSGASSTDTVLMLDDTRLSLPWVLQTVALLGVALLLIPGAPAFRPSCALTLVPGIGASVQFACGPAVSDVTRRSTSPGAIVWWRDIVPANWRPQLRSMTRDEWRSSATIDTAGFEGGRSS